MVLQESCRMIYFLIKCLLKEKILKPVLNNADAFKDHACFKIDDRIFLPN